METITEMKDRHWKEKEDLRNTCKHPVKSLIKREDDSNIGCGALYSRKEIICKLCGTKKMVFGERDWKGIKKTMKKTNLKDERFSFITYTHELE